MGFPRKTNLPPPPGASDSPFPSQQKKFKNIRNVHQELFTLHILGMYYELLSTPKVLQYKMSGLPFCRAFVVMKFHSESVNFVMDFCVIFFCDFFGAFRPFKRRAEIHREIHSKIHDYIPAKSTHVVKKRRRRIHPAGRGARQNEDAFQHFVEKSWRLGVSDMFPFFAYNLSFLLAVGSASEPLKSRRRAVPSAPKSLQINCFPKLILQSSLYFFLP